MAANAEKSAQLASTMITVVILSSLVGMGGTWAYENRDSLRENGEEWLYRLPRPHLWGQPAGVKTSRNDPSVRAWTLPTTTVDYSKFKPAFDPSKMVMPRVEVSIPRNISVNPSVYVPYRPATFR
jgi:hypothetical protein